MNKQGKNGIEWTKTVLPDGTERQGYTWNPVGGCKHGCEWRMPDGTVAECYAKTVAERFRSDNFYKHGFERHYWHPERLSEPFMVKEPSRIFLDSMSDLMGKWVTEEQIVAVLTVCEKADWHTFQLLTKNAPRLLQFNFPPNVWVGVSAPPSFMFGKELSFDQQKAMVSRQLDVLRQINVPVRWMSIEPLSFDIAPLLAGIDNPLRWAVIGAASNGAKTYQPERAWVQNLLDVLDEQGIPVFFKGNLQWKPWREHFPGDVLPVRAFEQMGLFT